MKKGFRKFLIKMVPALLNIPFLGHRYYLYIKNRLSWQGINLKRSIFDGNQMNLYVNDWVQKSLFVYGEYERKEIRFWQQLARKRKTIFDIGGHVGYYSLVAAKAASTDTKIYCFEPIRQTFERAKENIALNGYQNIYLQNFALSNEDGSLQINIGGDENWGMSSINAHAHTSGKTETVNKQTVDSFCNAHNINQIDLVKIDVEGSEFYVLQGMKQMIASSRPVVLIEILEQTLSAQGIDVKSIYQFFADYHYHPYNIMGSCELSPIKNPSPFEGLVCFWPAEKSFDKFISIQE
ncbi:MAG TPA: FkbM family methyltransferase [Chitinophagaceae bacterium]|nr:FkbM family methyltransferase [Chitinophagaceae bacterium]